MASETMILLGVAVYLMITLGVGFYAARGTVSLSDYIVAGRTFHTAWTQSRLSGRANLTLQFH